ncbi:hypothetical protein LBMAG27_17320 [Bacteroidota bacterium]|nr:hypothetical protein LBMAG27_17320 [Bacteroidota bacterium]
MNIRDEILKEHSKKQSEKIAAYIGSDEKRFIELMNLFLGDIYRVTQRAAMIVSICAERNPKLIEPFLSKMVNNLNERVHDAVKRNTLRIFQFIELPKKLWGKTAGICFRFLMDANEPIAVKVFAMSVLSNICKYEPELKNELKLVLEDQLENASAGFKARAQKVLNGNNISYKFISK